MTERFSLDQYVTDERFQADYYEHQRQFADKVRDTDKVFISLVRGIVEGELKGVERPRLLDIGCSAGNLLLHLSRALPALDLSGGDMVTSIIEENRRNPELSGIHFDVMDVLDLEHDAEFDIAITSAVLCILDEGEFERAVARISAALKPGGLLLSFDWVHPYEQELAIVEKSKSHPEGLTLHFRPEARVRSVLETNGFDTVSFRPFSISLDLPESEGPWDQNSHTVMTADGERLIFRGALAQPWCHVVAQKSQRG
jgi:SAM-dependent methyltransferase